MHQASGETLISRCVILLMQNDREAAQSSRKRCIFRLGCRDRAQLHALPGRGAHEEDTTLRVFDVFFRSTEQGEFAALEDPGDRWQQLFILTERLASNRPKRRGRPQREGIVLVRFELEALGATRTCSPRPPPTLPLVSGKDVVDRRAGSRTMGCASWPN
jgi:hypothetical protein